MKHFVALAALACVLPTPNLAAQEAVAPADGKILGMLVDAENQSAAHGRAVVFLCDAATGRPLVAANRRPFGEDNTVDTPNALWHAITDPNGSFTFDDVPPGQYRMFAQAWVGIAGLPEDVRDASEILHLLGVAEDVRVTAGDEVRAFLRPAGAGSLTVTTDPEEASALLVLSTAAPLGDPVVGPAGWREPFVRGIIGVTHLTKTHATLIGVPEPGELYASALFFDNVPGVGTAIAAPGRDRTATLKIYSGWSNAHKDPPDRLLPLVEALEAGSTTLVDLFGVEFDGGSGAAYVQAQQAARDKALAHPEQIVTIAGVGDFAAIDVLAAELYKNLRKTRR